MGRAESEGIGIRWPHSWLPSVRTGREAIHAIRAREKFEALDADRWGVTQLPWVMAVNLPVSLPESTR